jgi:MGT family glycosyltransferase
MKALFLGLPLHGHTNPSLPLVRALVDRGDEVVYVSTDAFAARIREAGARFRPYRSAFLADLRQLPERTDALAWLLMRTTGDVLSEELDAFRAERPDYVITDSVAPWGQWTAEALHVPVVTSVTTFAVNRHVLAFAFARGTRPKSARLFLSKLRYIAKASLLGRRLRRRYGVQGTGIMHLAFGCSDLNIVYTSRLFQPCADTFDDRFVFIGPSIDPAPVEARFGWDEPSPDPLIYVSLGTLFNAEPMFYEQCFEAFRNESVRVLMAIGTAISAASLGSPPPNVIVQASVPQLEVLRRASVFVTHGGMNSVSESLSLGVPMVVIPQMGEQELVAHQVEVFGAGLFLQKERVTAAGLRESARRVLQDDSYRGQCARLHRSFEEAGGPSRGAETIVAFTRRHADARTEPPIKR